MLRPIPAPISSRPLEHIPMAVLLSVVKRGKYKRYDRALDVHLSVELLRRAQEEKWGSN